MLNLVAISALLLILVTVANWRLGFFDSGYGQIFAFLMYVIFWAGGTAGATVIAFGLHEMRH